jgi:putative NADH-flavin reductase
MKILLLGATGRVGEAIMKIVLDKGFKLTILVRDRSKIKLKNANLSIEEGDVYNFPLLKKLAEDNYDVLINVVGANPLKHSTLVADTAKSVCRIFEQKTTCYLAITGIAQMKKTFLGKISIGILKLTPVKHAITDHQNAYNAIIKSNLNYNLIACPYIVDGETKGTFKKRPIFSGGFKTIHPGDVAIAITDELNSKNANTITGIWY